MKSYLHKDLQKERAQSTLMTARTISRLGLQSLATETSLLQVDPRFTDNDARANWALTLASVAVNMKTGSLPYECQLEAALELVKGKIVDMKTGEGKTLSVILSAFILTAWKRKTHIITANPYLAERDATLARKILGFCGISVGCLSGKENREERRAAYASDVTYGTLSDFAFDYLRDTIRMAHEAPVQAKRDCVIVDEADCAMIDEANMPLVLSGLAGPHSSGIPAEMIVSRLVPNIDYEIDANTKSAHLTDAGITKVGEIATLLNLSEADDLLDGDRQSLIWSAIDDAVHARALKRDIDYIVSNGQIVVVTSNTGRSAADRRFNDNLHLAVEMKEGVAPTMAPYPLATISCQSFFRLYDHVCGTSGTAAEAADEFSSAYGLDVHVVKERRPCRRIDMPDRVHLNQTRKHTAIIAEIIVAHERGQPVLVGTKSVEESMLIADGLIKAGFTLEEGGQNRFEILNAANDRREAEIIAKAGMPGAVTVATDMAGRGTDIALGGGDPKTSEAVKDAGGLLVIGTSRRRNARIDHQLRGRAGRQGDAGCTVFHTSLDDDLFSDMDAKTLSWLEKSISSNADSDRRKMTRIITRQQEHLYGVEAAMRARSQSYEDVHEIQRRIIAEQRESIIRHPYDFLREQAAPALARDIIERWAPNGMIIDRDGFLAEVQDSFGLTLSGFSGVKTSREALIDLICRDLRNKLYELQIIDTSDDRIRRTIALIQKIDRQWDAHAHALADLKKSIIYQTLIGKDPFVQYIISSDSMFKEMWKGWIIEFCPKVINMAARPHFSDAA